MRDGQQVSYIGLDGHITDPALGDRGKVLAVGQTASHVLWTTGHLADQITLTDNYDLAIVGRALESDGLEDSLEYGTIITTAVRDAYDDGGEVAVLNFMAEQGHLACFHDIAEDTIQFIASRLRQDAGFQAVASHLEEDERESLVLLATHVLLRDAFTEEE